MKKSIIKPTSEAQFGVKLPIALINKIKKKASDENLNIKILIKEAVEKYLKLK